MKTRGFLLLIVLTLLFALPALADYDEIRRGLNTVSVMTGTWTHKDSEYDAGYRFYYGHGDYDDFGQQQKRFYKLLDVREDGTAYFLDLYISVTSYDRTGYINRQAYTWEARGDFLRLTETETGGAWDFEYTDHYSSQSYSFRGQDLVKRSDTTPARQRLHGVWQFAGMETYGSMISHAIAPHSIEFRDDYTFTMSASILSNNTEIQGVYIVTDQDVILYMPELQLITYLEMDAEGQTFCFNFGFGTQTDLYYARDLNNITTVSSSYGLTGTYWTGEAWDDVDEVKQMGILFTDEDHALVTINFLSTDRLMKYGAPTPFYGYNKQMLCTIQRQKNLLVLDGWMGYDNVQFSFDQKNGLFAMTDSFYTATMVRADLTAAQPYLGTWRTADGTCELIIRPDWTYTLTGQYSNGTPFEANSVYIVFNGKVNLGGAKPLTLSEDGQRLVHDQGYMTTEYVFAAPADGAFPTPAAVAPTMEPPMDFDVEGLYSAMGGQATPAPATPTPRPTATPTPRPTQEPVTQGGAGGAKNPGSTMPTPYVTQAPTATPTPRPTPTPEPVTVGGAGGAKDPDGSMPAPSATQGGASGSGGSTADQPHAASQLPISGDRNARQHILDRVSASAHISAKFAPEKAADGDPGTSWQFSLKKAKLGQTYINFRLATPGTVDELWLKNGFWRYTDNKDQYTRNSRPKKIVVSFRYNGRNDFTDELTFTLRDDDIRQNWMIIPLGRHENVLSVRITVHSIYKGTKYPDDVALSEVMVVERDTPVTIRALKSGAQGPNVLNMKLRLQELGYFPAEATINNKFNNSTVAQVENFQRINGITVTGVADIYTLALLYSGLALAR